MFQIVVVIIPHFEFLLQIIDVIELVFLVELFLVLSVASLHCTVLVWFTSVNKIVGDAVDTTENIQRVERLYRHIAPLVGAGVEIRKGRVVVGLDGHNTVWKLTVNNEMLFTMQSDTIQDGSERSRLV